jgi:hypothetical protein
LFRIHVTIHEWKCSNSIISNATPAMIDWGPSSTYPKHSSRHFSELFLQTFVFPSGLITTITSSLKITFFHWLSVDQCTLPLHHANRSPYSYGFPDGSSFISKEMKFPMYRTSRKFHRCYSIKFAGNTPQTRSLSCFYNP